MSGSEFDKLAEPPTTRADESSARLRRAHEVLTANGMTLDRLSADAMRHVVDGVGKIAKEALNV